MFFKRSAYYVVGSLLFALVLGLWVVFWRRKSLIAQPFWNQGREPKDKLQKKYQGQAVGSIMKGASGPGKPIYLSDNVTTELLSGQSTPDERLEAPSVQSSSSENWSTMLSSPRLLNSLLLLVSVGLISGSLWLQQQDWAKDSSWLIWGLLFTGLLVFMTTVRTIQQGRVSLWMKYLDGRWKSWLGAQNWQVVCLLLSPVLAIVATLAAGTDVLMRNAPLAVIAWLAGIGLALIGGWKLSARRHFLSKRTAVLLLGLVLVSFLIRGLNTSHVPVVLSGDEASAGLSAVEFVKGNINNIFRVGWFSFPSLYFYLQSIPISLLGQTIPALRLFAALAGALTVGGVYLVSRNMFGNWAALFAAIFLTAFHFHNHFSRIGLNNIWDGLWFVLVLGSIWVGWQKEDRTAFLVAGLSLGLSQYFYVSVRVLFGLLPVFIILAGLADRARIKRVLPDLVFMGLVCVVTVLPLAVFFIRFPEEFSAPLNRVTIFGEWMNSSVANTGLQPWQIVLRQIGMSFQGFTHLPIKMWYEPYTPLLRPPSATLFFLGAGLLLLKIKDTRTLLLGLWIISFGIIGGLSESTPAAQRYVAVAPAVAIVIGYGLAESVALLGRLWPQWTRQMNILALLFILLLGVDELRFYFDTYTSRGDFGGDNNMVAQRLADYLQDKDGDWRVLFFGSPRMGYFSFSTLPYLVPDIWGVDMPEPWGSPNNPFLAGDQLIFVFLPNHREDMNRVMASYPDGRLVEELIREKETLYWLYEVSSSEGYIPPPSLEENLPYPGPYTRPTYDPYPIESSPADP